MENVFTRFIETDKGPKEFTFRLIHGSKKVWFLNNSYKSYFRMEAPNGEWKILDTYKVPKWILDIELELARAITESL